MKNPSRRDAIKLASWFAATAPLLAGAKSHAQPKPASAATTFEITSFTGAGVDPDAAFAKAPGRDCQIRGRCRQGRQAGSDRAEPREKRCLQNQAPARLQQLSGFVLNGNGAQLINTTMGSTLLISGSSHLTIRDLSIDYARCRSRKAPSPRSITPPLPSRSRSIRAIPPTRHSSPPSPTASSGSWTAKAVR
jgi:hypothetical protein